MADTLTTITKLINSPPGQLAAGGVLAGIVWKFFERVEAVLTEQTKLEIAVWLLGVKIGQKVEPWPETFVKVLDRFFGDKPISWKCFGRSCAVTYVTSILLLPIAFVLQLPQAAANGLGLPLLQRYSWRQWLFIVGGTLLGITFTSIVPNYISVVKTRLLLMAMNEGSSYIRRALLLGCELLITFLLSGLVIGLLSIVWVWLGLGLIYQIINNEVKVPALKELISAHMLADWRHPNLLAEGLNFVPVFFTSVWLWLYAGSGFLLKAARRFDTGFDWFNRKFDIEHKPLSSIGLVAGALVAVVYWLAVIVSRVVG